MLKFLSSLSAAVSGGFKFGLKWVLDFGPEIGPLVWLINDLFKRDLNSQSICNCHNLISFFWGGECVDTNSTVRSSRNSQNLLNKPICI